MRFIYLFLMVSLSVFVSAQSAEWKYLRPTNTGFGGDNHQFLKVDRCGNKWSGGSVPFFGEGALSRFDGTTFTCWSNFEGYLPGYRIYDVAFDSNDDIWVATNRFDTPGGDGGVSHFNGTTWVTYNSGNSPLPQNSFNSIAIDHDDVVWVTFRTSFFVGGLAKFDGSNWTVYVPGNSGLPSADVSKVAVDNNNNIWVGSSAGLAKFDRINWTVYTASSGLSGTDVTDVEVDESTNKVYVSTRIAIDVYDGASWSHINSSNAPIAETNLWAVDARNDSIIISTFGGTVQNYIYNGSTWVSHLQLGIVFDVRIDREGNFWTAGRDEVVMYGNAGTKVYNSKNTGLTGMFNDDVYADKRNRLWFSSTDNGGVNFFDCPNWQDYNPYNFGLWPSPVSYTGWSTGVTEDIFGDIWMVYAGVAGAVVQVPGGNVNNPAAWTVWENSTAGIPLQFLKKAAADSTGNVWFGYTDVCAVARYERATNSWKNYVLFAEGQVTCGAGSGIKSIRVDHDNNVWVCGRAGLAKFDQVNWTFYSYLNTPMEQGTVFDITFDAAGNKWVATEHGLFKFDGTNWTAYNESNSGMIGNYATSVLIDNAGLVWVGCRDDVFPNDGALCSFDGTSWNTYTIFNSGLPDKNIDRLAMDRSGNLLVITAARGAAIFNPNGINGYQCLEKYFDPCPIAILPVIMEYFKGDRRDEKHLLSWKANCTGATAEFAIERSSNGRSFVRIGEITADEIRCHQPFAFTDSAPLDGMNYYRIRITDENGKVTYSTVIALLNKISGFEIVRLSPNPTQSGETLLELSSARRQDIRIQVADLAGRIVHTESVIASAGFNRVPLRVKSLNKGVYIIQLKSDANEIRNIKMVNQ
ncbi:MAG TPA: two-component regulator propeller domain-containing protein [Chitinophagaceae bacterium]|nr:two-component regulator propeller domain-containing protein [Chitinophagaceae bacterium]